jgi:hypothetical protein
MIRHAWFATSLSNPRARDSRGSSSVSKLTRLALLLGTLGALGATPRSSFAATYYVDKSNASCSNSGAGSQAQPYCSISAAVSARSAAGNTIIVNPGVYREQVTVAGSGTAASPLVLQASGPGVIVDGTDDFTQSSLWVQFSGNVWRAASVAIEPIQVFANNVRLKDSVTTTPSVLPTGRFHWISGQGLYVNVGGGNPASQNLQVGSKNYGFRLDKRSYVTIKGFEVRRQEARGVYLTGPMQGGLIESNNINYTAKGGLQAVACTSLVVRKNTVSFNGDHGIYFVSVNSCLIEENESFQNYFTTRRANGINTERSTNNVYRHNRLHHNQDTGLNFTTDANNNLSIQNLLYLNQDHGTDHTNCDGNVHIGDVAYRNYKDGFSIEGDTPNHKVFNCIGIENGIAVHPADGTLEYDLWCDNTSSVGFQSDYNIWWNSDPSIPPIKYIATKYSSAEAFAAATGKDLHSHSVNPMFADTAAANFHLADGSPAIDNATSAVANWPSTDFEGRARVDDPNTPNAGAGTPNYADRGAYEFSLNTSPIANLVADPNNGLGPLPVVANASTSTDPDGNIVSYVFNFGDGTTAGPQSSPIANHTYAVGEWVLMVTVTDNRGGTDTTAVPVVSSANLIGNGSFENNVTGWAPTTGSTLSRVAGGQDGSFAAEVVGPATGTATFSLNDSPNWINNTTAINTKYRFTAWVRSTASTGKAKLQVREFNANVLQATSQTTEVTLTPSWQLFTVDHQSRMIGSTLDFNVVQRPVVAGESFQVDNVTARVVGLDRAPQVTAPATASVAELQPIVIQVTALDPDGEQIGLTCDMSQLPAGHNATFVVGAGNTSGTFTWTPTYRDARAATYNVSFSAANVLTGTATSAITVTDVDPKPVVLAPDVVNANEGVPVSFQVTAGDPDSSAITTFAANFANLPAGHNATFTPSADKSSGTFTWTPGFNDAPNTFKVIFTATNTSSGADTTTITVGNVDLPPVVTAPPTFMAGEGAASTLTIAAADPDGQPIDSLKADLSGLPAGHNAVFSVNASKTSGTLAWTPALGTPPGPYRVVFTVKNAQTGLDTTDVVVNRKPVVTAPATATVGENHVLSLTVTVADADGDTIKTLTANLTSLPAGNNAVFTPSTDHTSGTLTWTPTANDGRVTPYGVTFTATSTTLSGTATSQITVDQPPDVTAPAAATVTETQPLTVSVTANDPDGQPITSLTADFSELPAGHNAVFTAAADKKSGTLTWTPTAADGRIPPYHVTFTATNALTGSSSTTITVDQPPVVVAPATVEGSETAPLSVNVTASDPDGQPLTALTANLNGLPAGHNAVFTASADKSSGTLTWTPTYNDSGTYTVTFTGSNVLSSGSASASIHVSNVDRAPAVTVAATLAVGEGDLLTTTVTVLDPDGDAIASLTANLSGLPSVHDAVFTPAADRKSGTLTWHPRIGDGSLTPYGVSFLATNALSGSASTAITVDRHPVVTAPATASGTELTEIVINVTASDPDGQAITSLTADLSSLPAGHGAVFTPGAGNTSGTLRWTPNNFAAPGPYNINFVATNSLSGTSTTAVSVINYDRPPVLDCPAVAMGGERTQISMTVTATDPDLEPITYLIADLAGLPASANAVFTPNATKTSGVLTWTPLSGDGDASPYIVTFMAGNAMETANATAIIVDRYPRVTAPATSSVVETSTVVIHVSVSDPDLDEVLSLHADLSELPAGSNAVFTANPDNLSGTLIWTPTYDDGRANPYRVRFIASNALAETTATMFTVVGRDRPPLVTLPPNTIGGESSQITVNVAASDLESDPIDLLTADLNNLPVGNNATFTAAGDNKSGIFRWTPTPAEAPGPYNVSFTGHANGLTTTSTISIRVDRHPVITGPTSVTASENSPLSVNFTVSDPDADAINTFTANFAGLPAGNNAVLTTSADKRSGTLTWTPTFNDSGGPYHVTLSASNALTATAGLDIRVANTDRAPVVTAVDSTSIAENSTVTVSVTASDPDGDAIGSLGANLSTLPSVNDAVFTPNAGNTSGTLTWKPRTGDGRLTPYNVVFSATNAMTGTKTTGIKVDQRPIVTLTPGSITVGEGTLVTINVSAVDPDGQAISFLTANLSGLPAGNNAVFTASPDKSTGTLTWTPSYTDFRVTPYTVTITASNALSAAAAATIRVNNTDRAPVITAPATMAGVGGAPLTVSLTAIDPDGEAINSLTADLSLFPAGHGATFSENGTHTGGTLTWTPDLSVARGPFRVTFTATNALPGSASTDVSIDQRPVVTAPATVNGDEGTVIGFDITAADLNADAITSLTANLAGLPAGHNAVFTPNGGNTGGHFSWTPTYNDAGGPYTVSFTAANTLSGSSSVAISVANVDRAPIVSSPTTRTTPEGGVMTISVTAADPDGQAVTSLVADLSLLPLGNNAVFTPGPGNTSGTLTWTPSYVDAGGPYNVTFTASNALNQSQTTAITVTNTDRAPVVTAPAAATGGETQLLTIEVTASDPDGQPISFLTADLAGFPAGNNAVFTTNASKTAGTLTWTPTFDDGRLAPYNVTFTSFNGMAGTFTTAVTITDDNRAPVVTAPSAVAVTENSPITINVTAGDPDGEAISTLTTDVSEFPAANRPVFTVNASKTAGTFTWTPSFSDGRGTPYNVTFAAGNSSNGTKVTAVTVNNFDRLPVVTAPGTASIVESNLLTVNVTATDPDGEAITSLTADLSALPAGSGATFTANASKTAGTLTWTPAPSAVRAAPYSIVFSALNALTGTSSTAVTVNPSNTLPVAVLSATPAAVVVGSEVTLSAAGSNDPDGTIASYRFDFGDGQTVGPQASPTATHVYAAGVRTAILTVTDNKGGVDTASVQIEANLTNLVTNGTFESNTTGWTTSGSVTLSRVTTASHSGSATMQLKGGSSTSAVFGTNDSPQYVATVAGVSRKYRFGGWVRGSTATDTGTVNIEIREFSGSSTQVGTTIKSVNTKLRTTWQFVTVDFTVTTAGTNLDIRFIDTPKKASETWFLDDVTAALTPIAPQAPVVKGPATVSALENAPITMNVTASTPDGRAISSLTADFSGLPAGHNAVFTPNAGKTAGTLTWTPKPADVRAAAYNVTFTAANTLSGALTTGVSVADSSAGTNLVTNGTFESNTTGWTTNGTVTLARVSGLGRTGTYGMRHTGGSSATAVFGSDDNPNFIASTAGVGRRYRVSGWVKGSTANDTGSVRLDVRELSGTTQRGIVSSTPVKLTTDWQYLTADYTITTASTALDIKFLDTPKKSAEAWVLDDVIAVLLPAGPPPDQAPVVTAPAAASVLRNHAVTVNVTVADPDGQAITTLNADLSGLPAGNNAVFSKAADNKSATLTWTPTVADIRAAAYNVTFTAANALSGAATTAITVTDSATTVNLVGNGGFETNLDGWSVYGSATITKVAGGHSGASAMQVNGSSSFGCDDLPNWVASVPAIGTQYRVKAWVRSASNVGKVKIRIYEFLGTTQQGTTVYSQEVSLTPSWQELVANYTTLKAGSTLSIRVTDAPVASSETFLVDDVSIEQLPAGGALTLTNSDDHATEASVDRSVTPRVYTFGSAPLALDGGAGEAELQIEGTDGPAFEGLMPRVTLHYAGREAVARTFVLGQDRNGDAVEEIAATFAIEDLRRVLEEAPADQRRVPVTIEISAGESARRTVPFELEVERSPLVFEAKFAPNPFKQTGTLSFTVTHRGPVRAEVFDVNGRRMRMLMDDGDLKPGHYKLPVNAQDEMRGRMEAGVYFYRIEAREGILRGRFVLMR